MPRTEEFIHRWLVERGEVLRPGTAAQSDSQSDEDEAATAEQRRIRVRQRALKSAQRSAELERRLHREEVGRRRAEVRTPPPVFSVAVSRAQLLTGVSALSFRRSETRRWRGCTLWRSGGAGSTTTTVRSRLHLRSRGRWATRTTVRGSRR